jgi:hypothetical protein
MATHNAATANAKREAPSEFKQTLTCMSDAFKELKDAWKPLYSLQQVQHLLCGV